MVERVSKKGGTEMTDLEITILVGVCFAMGTFIGNSMQCAYKYVKRFINRFKEKNPL
jgi:hypothetical protein